MVSVADFKNDKSMGLQVRISATPRKCGIDYEKVKSWNDENDEKVEVIKNV